MGWWRTDGRAGTAGGRRRVSALLHSLQPLGPSRMRSPLFGVHTPRAVASVIVKQSVLPGQSFHQVWGMSCQVYDHLDEVLQSLLLL